MTTENANTPLASRAVTSDDGRAIRLALYGASRYPLAAVTLPPLEAGRLAYDLLQAMLRRLRRPYDAEADYAGSYQDGICALGEQVAAGRELPPDSPYRPGADHWRDIAGYATLGIETDDEVEK